MNPILYQKREQGHSSTYLQAQLSRHEAEGSLEHRDLHLTQAILSKSTRKGDGDRDRVSDHVFQILKSNHKSYPLKNALKEET